MTETPAESTTGFDVWFCLRGRRVWFPGKFGPFATRAEAAAKGERVTSSTKDLLFRVVNFTPLCGAENPDYPGEYRCTMPAGHGTIDLVDFEPDEVAGNYADHGAPFSGAYWSGFEPGDMVVNREGHTSSVLAEQFAEEFLPVAHTLPEITTDEVAKVIWETSRADEGTISATGANIVARAVHKMYRSRTIAPEIITPTIWLIEQQYTEAVENFGPEVEKETYFTAGYFTSEAEANRACAELNKRAVAKYNRYRQQARIENSTPGKRPRHKLTFREWAARTYYVTIFVAVPVEPRKA